MENRAYALAAGMFALLLGTGVIAAALWFSGDVVSTVEYKLVSRFPVSGLNSQAPVRFRGLTVGKVISIQFDPAEPRAIVVGIAVASDTPLTRGTYAQLGSQGVTGLAYVILDDDGSKPERLASEGGEAARIEFRQSFMDSVSASGQDMINNFNVVAKRVNTLLGEENQRQLMSTLRNLDQVSARVAALANSIDATVKTLEPTINALPALAQNAGLVLKRADGLILNIDQRVDSFERAARSAEQLGNSGAALAEAVMTESLPRLSVLLEDMQHSSHRLERLLRELNDQPQSIVFGRYPHPPGPGEPGFVPPRGAK